MGFAGAVATAQLGFLLWTAGSVIQLFVNNIHLFMLGRGVLGVGAGIAVAGGLVYVAQMVRFRGLAVLAMYSGGMCGAIAGAGISVILDKTAAREWQNKIPVIVQASWAASLALLGFLLPGYPPWLQWRGFLERANETRYVLAPRAFPENEVPFSWKELLNHKKTLFSAVWALLWLHFSGISALMFCILEILPQFRVGQENRENVTFTVYSTMAAASLLASPIFQFGSCRFFSIYGYGLLGACFCTLFGVFMQKGQEIPGELFDKAIPPESAAWALAVLLFGYTLDAIYISPLGLLYAMETLPRRAIPKGICISVSVSWFFYGVSMFGVPLMVRLIQEWAFFVLGVNCVIGVIFFGILGYRGNEDGKKTETDSKTARSCLVLPKAEVSRVPQSSPSPALFPQKTYLDFKVPEKEKIKFPPLASLHQSSSDPVPASELPLVTAKQYSTSSESRKTEPLQTAKAHQSVKLELGSHLNGLWLASEVGFEPPGEKWGLSQPLFGVERRQQKCGFEGVNGVFGKLYKGLLDANAFSDE